MFGNITRRIFILMLLVLTFAFFIIPASAHSGNTDENGGHYNRSTGEYHYHHGYPAHQHVNGECPYDFDDQTNDFSDESHNDKVIKWYHFVLLFIVFLAWEYFLFKIWSTLLERYID